MQIPALEKQGQRRKSHKNQLDVSSDNQTKRRIALQILS